MGTLFNIVLDPLPHQLTARFQESSARSMLLEGDANDLRCSFRYGLPPPVLIEIRGRKTRIDRIHCNTMILELKGQLDGKHVQGRLRRAISQHLHVGILPSRVTVPRDRREFARHVTGNLIRLGKRSLDNLGSLRAVGQPGGQTWSGPTCLWQEPSQKQLITGKGLHARWTSVSPIE
jgi:hypothetical protein